MIFLLIVLLLTHKLSITHFFNQPYYTPISPALVVPSFPVQFVQFYFLMLRANPLFVRSLLPTAKSQHGNHILLQIYRNPLFIRSMFLTHLELRQGWVASRLVAIPSSSGLCFSRLNLDNSIRLGVSVAIPSSSGLCFSQQPS